MIHIYSALPTVVLLTGAEGIVEAELVPHLVSKLPVEHDEIKVRERRGK